MCVGLGEMLFGEVAVYNCHIESGKTCMHVGVLILLRQSQLEISKRLVFKRS